MSSSEFIEKPNSNPINRDDRSTDEKASGRSVLIPAQRMEFIDTLRGFACLWVLFYHGFDLWGWHPEETNNALIKIILKGPAIFEGLGYLGVNLFLTLSGFCLYYPFVRKQKPSNIHVPIKQFAYRRAKRILPPYYISFLCVLVLISIPHANKFLHEKINFSGVITHLTVTHNLFTQTVVSYNGPWWSIALECQLYIVFPFLVIFARKYGIYKMAAFTFIFSIIWQIIGLVRIGNTFLISETPNYFLGWAYYNSLPSRFFEFAMGMLAAYFVAHPNPESLKKIKYVMIVSLIIAFPWTSYYKHIPILQNQLWGVFFSSAIVSLGSIYATKLEHFKVMKLVAWIGIFSYSIYLIHYPIIKLSATLIDRHNFNPIIRMFLFAFIGAPILVSLGYLFYLVAERPFLNRKPKLPKVISAQ